MRRKPGKRLRAAAASGRCFRLFSGGLLSLALWAGASQPAPAQAQQVPIPEGPGIAPQLDVAGVGVGTLDGLRPRNALPGGGFASSSQINIEDSALLIGAAERMYRGGIGSFALGALATEQTNSSTGMQFLIHQAYLDYQAFRFESYIGRTDQPTAQNVIFPTLRGDDLVTFTTLLNPFANGGNLEEHRYSNVGSVILNQRLQHFENIHVQHLIDSAGAAGPVDTGINSIGLNYQWLNLPGLTPIQRLVSYGAGWEHRTLSAGAGGRSDALYGGGVVNLVPSLTDRVDFRVQDILTFGNALKAFGSLADTYRADGNSIAAAVRYLHSPFGTPGYQVSLTGGWRSYAKVPKSGSVGVALTGVKRLGQGFDAVAQYIYQHRDSALAAAYGGAKNEQAIQVGLVFNFDATINPHLGPRRTLLNLQHHYIPN